MKKLMISALFAAGIAVAVEAAPTDAVTQADLQALIQRINNLEAQNKAQAEKIAQLEGRKEAIASADNGAIKVDEGTEVSESGRVYTTKQGYQYYLADKAAGIFEPLSESGLKVTPYGWLCFEAVYNTHGVDCDWSTDMVRPKSDVGYHSHNETLSMQDSIFGLAFETPERINGWKFSGKAEFDLAGGNQNSYDFHWRHVYVNAENENGWSILFGQTWHLWKMVTPSEIDGAWLENAGHPYRRSPQLRVTKKWEWDDSSLEARVGIVKGGPGMGGDRDEDGIEDNTASNWALIEGAIVYDHKAAWEEGDRRWLIGLGGMYGQDRSRRTDGRNYGQNDDYNSQMIMLAGALPFFEKFTLTGQIFAGENLGGVQGGCGQRVATRGLYQKGDEVATVGGFIDLGYELNSTWSFAVGYGCDNPNNSDAKGADGVLMNDRAYIDAFYKITSNFKLGVEYARLSTKYDQDGTSTDNRFQFTAYYDF